MSLHDLRRSWQIFGQRDPLWAVLSDHAQRGGKWQPEAFFRTGEQQIDRLLRHIAAHGYTFAQRRACLDFGCGVGRLSQALCAHFATVTGVDIAPAMIRAARRYNRHGARCRYVVNNAPDLRRFASGSFDLVYSSLVLQHIPPTLSRGYIQEFVRLLAPGGLAVFQIPAERTSLFAQFALPAAAQHALIDVQTACAVLSPGEQRTLAVRVVNRSALRWPGTLPQGVIYFVGLGARWRDWDGTMLLATDERAYLQADVPPGDSTLLHLSVTAPQRPGDYLLEIDMVQEGGDWFQAHGSPPARLLVKVAPQHPAAALRTRLRQLAGRTALAAAPPVMEMHGIPRDEVLRLLAAAGGSVLAAEADDSVGIEWASYTYYVTTS